LVHCVWGSKASMRSASERQDMAGDEKEEGAARAMKRKGPLGPRGKAARRGGQADCRMNSAILGQIISRHRRPEKMP